jgi:hypothetical protein
MLIQKSFRLDSIIACEPHLADFCNNIGPKATSEVHTAMSGFEGKAAVQRTLS